jgi:hypothetical protein
LNITSDLALTIGAVTGVFIVLIMAVLVAALPMQKANATDLVGFPFITSAGKNIEFLHVQYHRRERRLMFCGLIPWLLDVVSVPIHGRMEAI